MNASILFLLVIISAWPAHAQVTDNQKLDCGELMLGNKDPNKKQGFMIRMNEIESLTRDLNQIDLRARDFQENAAKIRVTRAQGFTANEDFLRAECLNLVGEKQKRNEYCAQCEVIRTKINSLDRDLKKKCPLHAHKFKEFMDKATKGYTQSCKKKVPYNELCKKK